MKKKLTITSITLLVLGITSTVVSLFLSGVIGPVFCMCGIISFFGGAHIGAEVLKMHVNEKYKQDQSEEMECFDYNKQQNDNQLKYEKVDKSATTSNNQQKEDGLSK